MPFVDAVVGGGFADLGSAVVVRGDLDVDGHRQAQVVQAVGDRGGEGIGVTRPFLTLLCEDRPRGIGTLVLALIVLEEGDIPGDD